MDRYGEKVDQDWNVNNLLKNSIELWNHRSGCEMLPEGVMGNWGDFGDQTRQDFCGTDLRWQEPEGRVRLLTARSRVPPGCERGFTPHSLEFDEVTPMLNDAIRQSFFTLPYVRDSKARQ